jgi:hypothetical protein
VEDVAEGAPAGEGSGVSGVHDRQGSRGDRGVVLEDNDEVVEHPVGGALGKGAIDVIKEPELGEGSEESAEP